jgi:hypothetical protein
VAAGRRRHRAPGAGEATPRAALNGVRTAAGAGIAFAALSLLAQGYGYGVADHVLHLPMAAEAAGRPLPPGDLLAGAWAAHPTLWWPLLAALGPRSALALHVGLLVATGAAIDRLARACVGPGAPWAVALLAVGQAALGGVDTADPLLLPRGAALPLELLAWAWFVGGQRGRAFALLGACVGLHAPSAAALGLALAGQHVAERRSWRPLLLLPLLAAPAALPALLGGRAGALLTPAHAALIDLRLGHHVDAATWPTSSLVLAAAQAAVLAVGWQRAGPALRRGVLALAAVGAIGGGAGWALGVALPVQLELWQAGRFLSAATCIAAAGVLVDGRRGVRELAALLLGVGLLVPGAFALAAARRAGPTRSPHPLFGLALIAALALAARQPPSGRSPARWFVDPPPPPLADAVAALPEGTLLAVPPVGFEGLRRGGVGLYGTWKDGGEALFDPALAAEWRRRMELLSGAEALEPLGREPARGARQVALRTRLGDGFDRQDGDLLARTLAAEGVSALVLRAPGPPGWTVRAEARGWVLVDLRPPPSSTMIAR